MKNKKLIGIIVVLGIVTIGILVLIFATKNEKESDNNNGIFNNMNKVTSIKMIYRKEKKLDTKLAKALYNMPETDIEEYTLNNSNAETGKQNYVIKFYDKNSKELYHIQYYPEKENELEIYVIKNTQQSDETRARYRLTNQKIIKYLNSQESKVGY